MENTSLRDSIKVELVSIRDLSEEYKKEMGIDYTGVTAAGYTHELRVHCDSFEYLNLVKIYSPSNIEKVIKDVMVAFIEW